MSTNVCVVIPYYEAGNELVKTVESLSLRKEDLVIVVDDGSIRKPASLYCPGSLPSAKIRLITLPSNQGITSALLTGIAHVPDDFTYIARMDCGDICRQDRFERQRELLDATPSIGLVGSWANFITPTGRFLYTEKYPTTDTSIRSRMRVNSAFCHPAVMFRASSYKQTNGYSRQYPAAEDYALFREMLRVCEGYNIPEPLIDCLTADGGISQTRRTQQLRTRIRIIIKNFDWHPMSLYGIVRASLQILTPRSFTSTLKSKFLK